MNPSSRRNSLKLAFAVIVAVAGIGAPVLSTADQATERGELARLLHELELLEARIELAEAAANSTCRNVPGAGGMDV